MGPWVWLPRPAPPEGKPIPSLPLCCLHSCCPSGHLSSRPLREGRGRCPPPGHMPSMAPTWSPSVASVVGPVWLFLILLARGCTAEGKRPCWSGVDLALRLVHGVCACSSPVHCLLVWPKQSSHT